MNTLSSTSGIQIDWFRMAIVNDDSRDMGDRPAGRRGKWHQQTLECQGVGFAELKTQQLVRWFPFVRASLIGLGHSDCFVFGQVTIIRRASEFLDQRAADPGEPERAAGFDDGDRQGAGGGEAAPVEFRQVWRYFPGVALQAPGIVEGD